MTLARLFSFLNDEIDSLEPSLRGAFTDHFSVTDFICAAAIFIKECGFLNYEIASSP